ncbi:hypothetical protein PHYPO_G00047890 [Pangasianodon hypophthalmus]|uniref:Uncharacterized protein n=1 Tax=Pangasianodon hypophthalmus TaxID=310915 RepID=A0A5N5MIG7_PANHP|nr:hypothetical protein PHYPO_G00047890 [Pangasianodon hypophthalmus]
MASSSVSPEPLDVLQDSDNDDGGNNLSGLEDEDNDEEIMDLDEDDSADESDDDEWHTPPAKKPHESAQSKSPLAWKTPEDTDKKEKGKKRVIRFFCIRFGSSSD